VQTEIEFSGVWIPLITPFRDGRVDHGSLSELVCRLKASGIAGFTVCATTGEAPLLDDDERVAVLSTVKSHAALPVMMGASGATPARVIARMQAALAHRPDAFLVSAPAYLRPSQAALRDYFVAIADASPLPIVIYDIPARTGVRLELETLLGLAAHPRIRAVKDCGGRVDQTEALIVNGRLQVLCGNDSEWFVSRCLGGVGAAAASAHVRTDLFVAFDRALAESDLPRARTLWRHLKPLTTALFDEPSPAPIKAVLAAAGECSDELRAPMTRATHALRRRLIALVEKLPLRA